MSITVNHNKEMMMLDPQVLHRLINAAHDTIPYPERLSINQHLEKINPHFKSAMLVSREDRKTVYQARTKIEQARLKHWKSVINQHQGKTVYVSDSYGIRPVTIHGPAHTPSGTIRKGYIEVRDDEWLRRSSVDSRVNSSLNAYECRGVQRRHEFFVVRIVSAAELHVKDPSKD